ncbi:hypothetical protein [uncultured Dysosmobacter sp.]|uniref:hypothetical protein n=1 Tax=uncultured Dysosmobacter sp. TaxID=2591384 RepID=UPI002616277D|nr:hypothetical protein [uncultured Dysosmobacter sp.]
MKVDVYTEYSPKYNDRPSDYSHSKTLLYNLQEMITKTTFLIAGIFLLFLLSGCASDD